MWKCGDTCVKGPFVGGGTSSWDYWHKCEVRRGEKIVVGKYTRKYTKKWPHCLNLGSCFS